jgi:hypothetical protein
MTFPIHMDALGSFVARLRGEGFDARTDLFNGQVGLIVGPKGLDPKRMPPDTSGLFFPLWELNYRANREFVEARRFHDIFESRPPDWKFNRPYHSSVEHERLNLHHWNRSVSLLGDRNVESATQQALIRLFPPSDFPVNIDVVGGQMQTYATIRVSNFDGGIDETAKAIPEDFLGSGGKMAAILTAVDRIVSDLQKAKRIPIAYQPPPRTHTDARLELRPVAYVGEGSDLTERNQVTQYEIQGLPPGDRAWIANFGAPYRNNWRILRATDEVQSDWTGDYGSAEDALAALQREFEA